MARPPAASSSSCAAPVAASKLDQLETMLRADSGTTIAAMMEATGWLQHSVRGALAGALKRRGLIIVSAKIDGVRHYRASDCQ